MNISITYDNQKILDDWRYISHNIENFNFEYLSDRKEMLDAIDELSDFFNPPILSLFEDNREIYHKVKEIKAVIEKIEKGLAVVSYSDKEIIKINLEKLFDAFKSIENIQFYIELNRKTEAQFRAAEKIRDDKSAQSREKNSIWLLDKEFSNEYNNIFCWLIAKNIIFFLLVICSLFIMIDIFKSLPIKDSVDIYGLFFMRFVIYVPFLIAMIFLLRQINQDRKIAHIYLHKRVIARSYINYTNALSDRYFGTNDLQIKQKMQEMLLQTIIEVLKENPVSAFYKEKEASEINSQTVIEKLIDKIPSFQNSNQ